MQNDYHQNFEITYYNNQKALKIREQTNDKNGIALSYNNLGVIYTNQNNYPKAFNFFQKALKINQEASIQPAIATNYNNLGELYYQQGKKIVQVDHLAHLEVSSEIL